MTTNRVPLAWAGDTAASPTRSRPEDTFVGSPHGPWLVVDAFGGQGSGPYAAQMIASELAVDGDPRERFAAALARLATGIGPNGGGGSAVRLTIIGAVAELAWLGDCRAYRLRDGHAEQLTRDHTFVQQCIDASHLTAEEAAASVHENILTRALMSGIVDEPELVHVDLQPGDGILLISDGVWRAGATLDLVGPTPQAMVHELLAATFRRSTDDDATAVLVVFTDEQ